MSSDDTLTVEKLLKAKGLLDKETIPVPYKEFYPAQYNNPSHPFYEYCNARVEKGIGKWLGDITDFQILKELEK